jgi:hypothetical protein
MSSESDLGRLLSEAAIRRVIYKYCRAVDTRDERALREVYHPGAVENHGTFDGPAASYVRWALEQSESRFAMTQHYIANIEITFETDTAANVESSFFAVHEPLDSGGDELMFLGGRYADVFHRDQEWRIRHRTLVVNWAGVYRADSPFPGMSSFRRASPT